MFIYLYFLKLALSLEICLEILPRNLSISHFRRSSTGVRPDTFQFSRSPLNTFWNFQIESTPHFDEFDSANSPSPRISDFQCLLLHVSIYIHFEVRQHSPDELNGILLS